jgi:twitching motility protein PilT
MIKSLELNLEFSLEKILSQALALKASELVLAPGYSPRFRVGNSWHYQNQLALDPKKIREYILPILDEEQKASLENSGMSQGSIKWLETVVRWQILSSERGLSAHFQWSRADKEESWNFPQSVFEILEKGHGLTLVSAPKRSGKSSAVRSLLSGLSAKKIHISIFSDYNESNQADFESENKLDSLIEYFPTERLDVLHSCQLSSDIIVIDSAHENVLIPAYNFAKRGYNVILTWSALSTIAAFEDIALGLGMGQKQDGLKRLAQVFQMALGVKVVCGIDSHMQPVYELIMGIHQLKSHLAEGRWELMDSLIQSSGEKTGMRSMNQSLMQLLLKRKIELKVGFESSTKPDELDLLLRKAGF